MKIRAATSADLDVVAVLNGAVRALHLSAEPTHYRPTRHADVVAWLAEASGRPLMDAVRGEGPVELDVRTFNTEAVRFYEALGFEVVKLRLRRSGGGR